MLEVEYHVLTSLDSSNRYLDLDGTPVSSTNVALDLISGTAQSLNGDFGVVGNRILWDSTSYGLYSALAEGDHIRVIYDRT